MVPRLTLATFLLLMWFVRFDQSLAFGAVLKKAACLQRCNSFSTPTRLCSQSDAKSETQDDGVIELSTDMEGEIATATMASFSDSKAVAPFLSQGEILEETLKVDLSNPKQTRVIIYIILSLLPVLFLIPLMLGSREFLPAIIPMDELPPVQL
jgi:hypothetical protein